MAEVKWSDDLKFVPQSSLADNDHIMGLTSSNVNAKYPGSLIGTVRGPDSSTDNAIPKYDGTTGKLIQNTSVTIDDANNVTATTGSFISTLGSYNAPLGGFYGIEAALDQVFFKYATLSAPGRLYLPNFLFSQRYVSMYGSDVVEEGNGQIVLPWATIQYGVTLESPPGCQINVMPGSYSDSSFAMYPHKVIQGSGKYTTLYTVGGACSVESSQWNISTSPSFEIRDIQLQAGSIDFTPTSKISNSRQSFINFRSIGEVLTTGNLTTVEFDGCELQKIVLTDVNTVIIRNTKLTDPTTPLTITNNTITTTVNVYLENVDFGGGDAYSTLTDFNCGPFNINLLTCTNIGIWYDNDQGFGIVSTYGFDYTSYPDGGIFPQNGTVPTVNYLDKLSWFDGRNGIGSAQTQFYNSTYNPFFWTGASGSNPYIFAAGEGVHFNPGKHHNILLGNWSTTNFNGCFVWADGATTELANHFPSADNQFVIWPRGGFGVSVQNNTVRAGFHYGHQSNDGNILLSSVAEIADGNILASEVNHVATTDAMLFKYKNSGGTVRRAYVNAPVTITAGSQTLTPGCEYIADNASLITFTLPTTAVIGDKYKIRGKGAGMFRIRQNASQSIAFLNQSTTVGTGGGLDATNQYQCIEIMCITANTGFTVINSSGTFTVI